MTLRALQFCGGIYGVAMLIFSNSFQIDNENDWKICVSCLKSIEKAAKFREMAKKSDDQIREFLAQESNESLMTAEEPNKTSDDAINFDYENNEEEPGPSVFEQMMQVKQEVGTDDVALIDSADDDEDTPASEGATPATTPPPPMVRLFPRNVSNETQSSKKMKIEPQLKSKTKITWRCCGAMFDTRESYRAHQVHKHRSKTVFRCDLCQEMFHSMNAVNIHKVRDHGQQKVPSYACNICGKQYSGHSGVHYHKKVKHPELFQQ